MVASVKELGTKYLCLSSVILFGVGNGTAIATVFEYDSDGNQTIIEKRQESISNGQPPASTPDADVSELKELTRAVGIRFSG